MSIKLKPKATNTNAISGILMADVFISYRRKPSGPLALLIQEKLRTQHRVDAYVDTTRADSTRVQFPERLMQAIADTPVFVCLLSDDTLDSDWVRNEIRRAYELRKFCIPIFQERYVSPSNSEPAVDYLLNHDGVHIFDVKNVLVDESISKIAGLVRRRNQHRFRGFRAFVSVLIIAVLAGIFFIIRPEYTPPVTPTLDARAAALATLEAKPTEVVTDSTAMVAALEATENYEEAVQLQLTTIYFEGLTATATFFTATVTDFYTATREVSATPTHTHTATPSSTSTATASPSSTFTPSRTSTSTFTITPTVSPTADFTATREAKAFLRVLRNADWTVIERNFQGVPMVLVPVGCFDMGGISGSVNEDSVPIHHVCFDRPFWIDKTEVTQAQFREQGGSKAKSSRFLGDNRPVENITWFEADNFCRQRGGRLPTEAEWEYAARGPDNLLYPWGNTFMEERTVFGGNSNTETAIVGSKVEGSSWIGALDLAGNVYEWMSNLYNTYPRNWTEEAENDTSENLEDVRVTRGGAWNYASEFLSAIYRYPVYPFSWGSFYGLRCVRPY